MVVQKTIVVIRSHTAVDQENLSDTKTLTEASRLSSVELALSS